MWFRTYPIAIYNPTDPADIRNKVAWDYIVEKNKEISAWRSKQARERETLREEARQEHLKEMEDWYEKREQAKRRIFDLIDAVQLSVPLRDTQPEQLATLKAFIEGATHEDVGMNIELFAKKIQRARALLLRHGASEADLQMFQRGFRQTKPKRPQVVIPEHLKK